MSDKRQSKVRLETSSKPLKSIRWLNQSRNIFRRYFNISFFPHEYDDIAAYKKVTSTNQKDIPSAHGHTKLDSIVIVIVIVVVIVTITITITITMTITYLTIR